WIHDAVLLPVLLSHAGGAIDDEAIHVELRERSLAASDGKAFLEPFETAEAGVVVVVTIVDGVHEPIADGVLKEEVAPATVHLPNGLGQPFLKRNAKWAFFRPLPPMTEFGHVDPVFPIPGVPLLCFEIVGDLLHGSFRGVGGDD